MRESTRTHQHWLGVCHRFLILGLVFGGCVLTLAAQQTKPAEAETPARNDANIIDNNNNNNNLHGQVVKQSARWGYNGSIIVTESTIELANGTLVVAHQLGGQVGEIGMRVSHSPALLPLGAWVEIDSRQSSALGGRHFEVIHRVLSVSSSPIGTFPFVRTTNNNRTPLAWESGCTRIGMEASGANGLDGELAAIARSVSNWNAALSSCSYLNIEFIGPVNAEPGFDGVSVIRFREDRWCRPATKNDPETCHDPAAAGLTFLTFGVAGDRDGAILDADIELNGVDFGLVINGAGTSNRPCAAELENTLTHELGHFLGLDHTCWDGLGIQPVDETGAPVPDCLPVGALPSKITEATMYPFQDCGETKKTSLSTDDAESVCTIYPRNADPGECIWPEVGSGGFCSVGRGGVGRHPGSWLLIVCALVAIRFRPAKEWRDS